MKSVGNAGKILNKSAVKSLNLHDPAEMKTSRAHTLHCIKDTNDILLHDKLFCEKGGILRATNVVYHFK